MIRVNCCSAEFSGLKTAHCTVCHATFTTVSAFDKHRAGSHTADTRHCYRPNRSAWWARTALTRAGDTHPKRPKRKSQHDRDR
jgi:hypothetical protein